MENKYLIGGHKLYWHLDRVQDWMNGKKIYPLYIDMSFTKNCNIGCKYCEYATYNQTKKEFIPLDILKKFFRDCKDIGIKAIGVFGDGEPMLHPNAYEAVTNAKECGLDIGISTNGILMKEEGLREFLEALTFIRFNMVAGSPDTYAKTANTSKNNFYKVKENIKKCVDIKKKYNLPITIGIQMVLISTLKDDIINFCKIGKELGVDYAMVKQCTFNDLIDKKYIISDKNVLEETFRECEGLSTDAYEVIIKREQIKKQKKTYDTCYGGNFILQMSGTGDVYVCSGFSALNRKSLGNIKENSIKDILNSEKYNNIMKEIEKIDVHKNCLLTCRHDEINEFLWVLKHPPEHINFI